MSSLTRWAGVRNTSARPSSGLSLGTDSGDDTSLGIITGIVSTCPPASPRSDAVKRRFILQGNARELLPGWRVCKCLRVPLGELVSVLHHPEFSGASYRGLVTCGSVHVCPVCGSKVAERRTQEINAGAAVQLGRCGGLIMGTFTLRHTASDSLPVLVGAMNEAYRKMRGSRQWELFKQRYGLVGSVTAREYTYGAHGWHPHMHALFFVRGGLRLRELREFENWLQRSWAKQLAKLNQFSSLKYGVDCRLSEDGALASYISKAGKQWTVGDELTKANVKMGRRGGRSVAQLLWDAGEGDEQAGVLFREYAQVTYRKNALVWSPGLRQLLGLGEEKSDEAVAAEEVAGGRLLVVFSRQQWFVILGNDARAEVLLQAAAGDAATVAVFVRQFGIELEPWQLEPISIQENV